jgi:hypothetical protein
MITTGVWLIGVLWWARTAPASGSVSVSSQTCGSLLRTANSSRRRVCGEDRDPTIRSPVCICMSHWRRANMVRMIHCPSP